MIDPTEAAATVTVLAAIVAKIVDRIRQRFPTVDGDVVTAVAATLGISVAYFADLQAAVTIGVTIPQWLDTLVTGLTIGLGSGVVADLTGMTQPKDTT